MRFQPDTEMVRAAIVQPGFEILSRAAIDPAMARTWDLTLVREQRLLVPVDVQAFVVPEGGAEETVAVAGMPGDPPPFDDGAVRPRGVHLHWALPDGLLRGEQSEEGDAVEFPLLPDRWVVVRTLLPIGVERALVHGWVIDALTKVVTPLADFTGTPAGPANDVDELDRLDGVFGGGLLWTASYEASAGRFGFHDPLDDLGALAEVAPDGFHRDGASYTVAGWWSDLSEDALDLNVGTGAVDDRLAELGWYVDHEGRSELVAPEKSLTTKLLENSGFRSAMPITATELVFGGVGATSSRVPAEINVPNPIPDAEKVIVGPALLKYLSLLHGSVLGVPLDDLPGIDSRPRSDGVTVAAGHDVDDVVSALGASALGAREEDRELAERLTAAFTGDLLDQLDQPDGLADLAEREHDDGFWPLAGPPLAAAQQDTLRAEDAAAVNPTTVGRKARSAIAPTVPTGTKPAPAGMQVRGIEFYGPGSVLPNYVSPLSESVRANVARVAAASRAVTRPAPRVFRPQAPMVGLRNLRPSLRHHGDGLYDDSGRLRVRYPSEVGDGYDGVLRGASVVPTLGSGAIPPEVLHLVREAVLLDPYAEAWHAAASAAANPKFEAAAHTRLQAEFARMYGTAAVYDGIGARFISESTSSAEPLGNATDSGDTADAVGASAAARPAAEMSWSEVGLAGENLVNAQVAAEAARWSVWNGTTPSPVAITTWRQPWVPLWVEWEVGLVGGTDLEGWNLGEVDFEPETERTAPDDSTTHTFVGRSPISQGVGTAIHEGITRWLVAEEQRDGADESILSDADEDALATLGGLLWPIDLVSASLDGVREQLLGIAYEGQIERASIDDDPLQRPIAEGLPLPLFGGELEIKRLRVVDAFGRTLDVPTTTVRTTTALEMTDRPSSLLLRPRLQHSARWLFRLVDPGHPVTSDPTTAGEAFVNQVSPELSVNPIAGYVLPDHIDEALEFFTTDGGPIGQLDHDGLSGAVRWETAPGRALPPDAGPLADLEVQSSLMGRIAMGLTEADVAARQLAEPPDDTPLTALLRAIDTTLWTVDTTASIGTPAIAGLVGRPVAVVRATLRLQAFDDVAEVLVQHADGVDGRHAAFDELDRIRFPARLGELTRSDDALLGFYVNDDYRHLHVVDRVVAAHAIDSGRHRSHFGLLGENVTPEERPITAPFLIAEDELWLRPGETVRLTLLMLPGGRVNLTSGILPRKALALADDWVRKGLNRIVPSVRTGPLLIDPGDVRLPKVHALGEQQSFIRRTGPLTWREDPIVSATQAALLPRLPHELQEGWIRVTPEDEGDET